MDRIRKRASCRGVVAMTSRNWWPVALFLGSLPAASAQELPAEGVQSLAAYEKAASKLTQEGDRKIAAGQKKLLQTLDARLKALSQEVKLDEAIAVRDLIRNVEKTNDARRQQAILIDAKLPPGTGAEDAIAAFRELVASEWAATGAGLKELRASLLKELAALQDRLAKNGQLDEAVAVRDRLRALSALADGTAAEAAIKLPDSPEEAGRAYQQKLVAARATFEERTGKEIAAVRKKLQALQEQTAKAGKLDEAVLLRDISKQLADHPQAQTALSAFHNQKPRLSAEATRVLAEFEGWWKAQFAELEAETTRLDRAWAPYEAARLKEKLKTSSLSEAQGMLGHYYRLRRDKVDWLSFMPNRPLPPPGEAAAKLFDGFQRSAADRLAEAEKKEQAARSRLQEALDQLPPAETPPEAQAELARLRRFLEADYSAGLRGTMLLEVGGALPDIAGPAVRAYQQETHDLMATLRKQHAAALEALQKDLGPVRDLHLQREEFPQVYAILARLPLLAHFLEPVRIQALQHPGFPHAADALLWDVRENSYLVTWLPFGPQEEWLAADRVLLSAESAKGRSGPPMMRLPQPDYAKGPGKAVAETTKLQRGQKALAFWGGRWHTVVV